MLAEVFYKNDEFRLGLFFKYADSLLSDCDYNRIYYENEVY